MATLRLPGLFDAHVHFRQPGYEYKEDFTTGTRAALAGGVTTVLDMPNTSPATSTPQHFEHKASLARDKIVCDVGLFLGATTTDLDAYLPAAASACGLKIYVSETFGSLCIESLGLLHRLFRTWGEVGDTIGYRADGMSGGIGPVAVHAEELMLPVCLTLAHLYSVPLHIVHVSRQSEIELIRAAKDQGYNVTCEVTPHHLFLSSDDMERLGPLGDMRPRLASPTDVAALWRNLDVVDIFATDHAPHTLEEKCSEQHETVPPGVPGVETMLPLLLTAVDSGRLTVDDILMRCVQGPQRVYGLPAQADTYVEVDIDSSYTLQNRDLQTKAGWSPFAGNTMRGKVERVVLRGQVVYDGDKVLVGPGSGRMLFVPDIQTG